MPNRSPPPSQAYRALRRAGSRDPAPGRAGRNRRSRRRAHRAPARCTAPLCASMPRAGFIFLFPRSRFACIVIKVRPSNRRPRRRDLDSSPRDWEVARIPPLPFLLEAFE